MFPGWVLFVCQDSRCIATNANEEQSMANSLVIHATKGIQFVFESLSPEEQKKILKEAASRYSKVLKGYSLSKNTNCDGSHGSTGGEMAFSLMSLMSIAVGKAHLGGVFDAGFILQLANTIQWRCDPKSFLPEDEKCFWDGTTSLCLLILSQLLWRERAKLAEAGVHTRLLKQNVVMVARPGKTPRKAIDFLSAISQMSRNGEPTAKLAAQRIEACMSADF